MSFEVFIKMEHPVQIGELCYEICYMKFTATESSIGSYFKIHIAEKCSLSGRLPQNIDLIRDIQQTKISSSWSWQVGSTEYFCPVVGDLLSYIFCVGICKSFCDNSVFRFIYFLLLLNYEFCFNIHLFYNITDIINIILTNYWHSSICQCRFKLLVFSNIFFQCFQCRYVFFTALWYFGDIF